MNLANFTVWADADFSVNLFHASSFTLLFFFPSYLNKPPLMVKYSYGVKNDT